MGSVVVFVVGLVVVGLADGRPGGAALVGIAVGLAVWLPVGFAVGVSVYGTAV